MEIWRLSRSGSSDARNGCWRTHGADTEEDLYQLIDMFGFTAAFARKLQEWGVAPAVANKLHTYFAARR